MASGVTVEEVRRSDQRRRFHEVGRVLFADEPRWAPPLRPYEAWLFERRHPYHRRAEVVRFLARREGAVVGRVCAHHVEGSPDGWFGAFEAADDATAVRGLVQAAREWVAERGATRLRGPATFTVADEAGVLVDGFEHPGGTGRPWHPPRYHEQLLAAGLADDTRTFPRWRLPTSRHLFAGASPGGAPASTDAGDGRPSASAASPEPGAEGSASNARAGAPEPSPGLAVGGPVPPHAGKLGDARLVLAGTAGAIAAVPDVAAGVRTTSLRTARRRLDAVTEAAVVLVDGDPARLVPALLAAAGAAGYEHVWSPWSPEDRPPDTVHRLLTTGAA